MCGICGIVGNSDKDRIRRMVSTIEHRGPDDLGVGVFPTSNVALGHTRLSILDLSPRGHQPMCDDDELLWVTYNGEIYNFNKIRAELIQLGYRFRSETDTEVLLYAYKEWGPESVKRYNGMFAFAIWDEKNKELFAARDRIGIKPFYYCFKDDVFVFASEIKAILASNLVEKTVDHHALLTPAMYQVAPFTGFKNILKLHPGTYLRLKNQELSIKRYWEISPSEEAIPASSALHTLDHILNTAVKDQMISDVPIGALLSGGLDSSIIVALMSKITDEPINTFTIKFGKRDQKYEKMADDSYYAQAVSKIFACNHKELEISPDVVELLPKLIWHLDEPIADPAAINTYLIAKAARENGIIVLLNGMGGDEIFGGYRKHIACLLADYYQLFVPEIGRRVVEKIAVKIPVATAKRGIRQVRWAKHFIRFANLPQTKRFFASGMISNETYRNLFSIQNKQKNEIWNSYYYQAQTSTMNRQDLSYLTRMCLSDTEVFLPDHNLAYSDKSSMAIGVECRQPLTDNRIVEFMFSVEPKLRINKLRQKHLLKNVAAKYLPKHIINRPKAPFGSPLRSWIRGQLSEMIDDYLNPQRLKKRGIYNTKYLEQKISRDKQGLEDNAHLIWKILCNEIWLETFFN